MLLTVLQLVQHATIGTSGYLLYYWRYFGWFTLLVMVL